MSRSKPCREWRETLHGLADGHGSQARRAALDAHARSCGACASELRDVLLMRGLLDGVSEGELTRAGEDAFIDSVFARIDEARVERVERKDGRAGGESPHRAPILLRAAVGALLAAAVILALLRPSGFVETSSEIRGPSIGPMAVGRPPVNPEPAPRAARAESRAREIQIADGADAPGVDEFATAIIEAARSISFDPARSTDAASLEEALGAEPCAVVAARQLVRSGADPEARALAARLLGLGADARDRGLLRDRLLELGSPAALALADSGRVGVALLWDEANGGASEAAARLAARALIEVSAADGADPLEQAPRGVRPDLAARVAAARTGRPAHDFLERFVDTGEVAWLDAWSQRPGAAASLEARLGRGLRSPEERRYLARAARLHPVPEALTVVMDVLLEGDVQDVPALVAHLELGGAEALIRATLGGRLDSEIEDLAWRESILANGSALLDAARANGRLRTLLDATVRAAGDEPCPKEFQLLLVRCAASSDRREAAACVDALLFLAEQSIPAERRSSEAFEVLRSLRDLRAPRLAAAAWMAWHSLGGDLAEAPPLVAKALALSGTATFRHAQLERAVKRLGARASQ